MQAFLLVEVDMSIVFLIMDWQRKNTLVFDIKFHDSFFNEVLT